MIVKRLYSGPMLPSQSLLEKVENCVSIYLNWAILGSVLTRGAALWDVRSMLRQDTAG